MFSTFNAIRIQANQHKLAARYTQNTKSNLQISSMDNNGTGKPKELGQHSAPAYRPSSKRTSAKQAAQVSVTTIKPDNPISARDSQSHQKRTLNNYTHLAPELVWWLISTLLILMGYKFAAFIPIILCIDLDQQSGNWVAHQFQPYTFLTVRRELCILSISMFLMSYGHDISSLCLLLVGTWLPVAHVAWPWMQIGRYIAPSGHVFIAGAAVALVIQGRIYILLVEWSSVALLHWWMASDRGWLSGINMVSGPSSSLSCELPLKRLNTNLHQGKRWD